MANRMRYICWIPAAEQLRKVVGNDGCHRFEEGILFQSFWNIFELYGQGKMTRQANRGADPSYKKGLTPYLPTAIIACIFLLWPSIASATTRTWTGGGGD